MKKKRIALVLAVVILAGGIFHLQYGWIRAKAEESGCVCWVMCKSYVVVRRTPSKSGQEVGYLECGDWFRTDGTSSNGYIRVSGVGEYGEGWVYSGYVVTEEPEAVFSTYTCVARKRVACRRWMGGDYESLPWLNNGSTVQVLYMADGWALTSRGYIRSEWLEAYP